ncbi:MAG: M20/M25/M40 family metallo-hydrolase [Arhodomonas sp.]|nr:M20/M25/M40 family metallo-hydrolase [Arhodomonas sp.]
MSTARRPARPWASSTSTPTRATSSRAGRFCTIDLRHPDDDTLAAMDADLRERVETIAAAAGLEAELKDFWHFPATPFAPELVERVRAGAERLGYRQMDIVSGAGHDAVYTAKVCPTAMIFVPCEGGISHNEAENIEPDDATRGAAVLYEAMKETAM